MNETDIRKQLEEVRVALKSNEDEHTVLESLLKGYEGWLRLRGGANGATQLSLPPLIVPAKKRGRGPKGTISFRQAVLTVVREARGEPLHVREILARTKKMGAITAAKDPFAITDLMSYSLMKAGEPMKKVAGRTWIWTGGS